MNIGGVNCDVHRGDHEVRCVSRKLLLEALAKELPIGNIRYSSKVVCIEESGFFKLVHLADGTILKTKVKLLYLNFILLSKSKKYSSICAHWICNQPYILENQLCQG